MSGLLTIREAAKAAAVDERTVRRWIKVGRISATVTQRGRRVDTAELLRVGALVNLPESPEEAPAAGGESGPELVALRTEVRLLRERVDELRAQRDAWQDTAQKLLALPAPPPEPPRRGWSLWPFKRR